MQGVAGRWSYVFHPKVDGDSEFYYFQRTSHDCTKACIVLKHRAPGRVVIFPRGLLPAHDYTIGFDSTRDTTTRTGADLMDGGIVVQDQKPGELIYLGLPRRPGGGQDQVTPEPPARVLNRRETNLGHTGVAVRWSPGRDDHWISYYEVRRGNDVLGKTSRGCYHFDHSAGWDPRASYAVRTLDGDGNASEWAKAMPAADEPLEYSALGGHFAESGREGWRARPRQMARPMRPWYGSRLQRSRPPTWGERRTRWEAPRAIGKELEPVRVGRGWQQSSKDAACVRAWIAPEAGTVRVIGRAIKEWYRQEKETSLQVRILHGTRQVWPDDGAAVVRPHDLLGAVHDFTLVVAAGDARTVCTGAGSFTGGRDPCVDASHYLRES